MYIYKFLSTVNYSAFEKKSAGYVADGADSYLYYVGPHIAPLAAPAVALVSAFGMAMLYSSCSCVCVIPPQKSCDSLSLRAL